MYQLRIALCSNQTHTFPSTRLELALPSMLGLMMKTTPEKHPPMTWSLVRRCIEKVNLVLVSRYVEMAVEFHSAISHDHVAFSCGTSFKLDLPHYPFIGSTGLCTLWQSVSRYLVYHTNHPRPNISWHYLTPVKSFVSCGMPPKSH